MPKNISQEGSTYRPEFTLKKIHFRGNRYATEQEAEEALHVMQDLVNDAIKIFPEAKEEWQPYVKKQLSNKRLEEEASKDIYGRKSSEHAYSGPVTNASTRSGTPTNASSPEQPPNNARFAKSEGAVGMVLHNFGEQSSVVVHNHHLLQKSIFTQSPEQGRKNLEDRLLGLLKPTGDKEVDLLLVRLYQDFEDLDERTLMIVEKLVKKHGHELPAITHMLQEALDGNRI
jgi:hypothetical protein